jgi:hypothetical protein
MINLDFFEEEIHQLENVLQRLLQDANAKTVVLMDKHEQHLVQVGSVESMDIISLHSAMKMSERQTGLTDP